MKKSIIQAIGVILLLGSCKPQQVMPSVAVVYDTTVALVPTDTIRLYWVTSQSDTLYALDKEVEIGISRLLKDTLTIIGVGDIMMGTNFPNKNYLPPNQAIDLWQEVSDTLRQADVTFGNLEGVILNAGGDQKKCNNPKVCYLFRSPTVYLQRLSEAGFDVVSLANNHAGDFGDIGRASTKRTLDSIGIHYAGLLDVPFTVFKSDGMRYGMIAFSPNKGTVSIHNFVRAKQLVQQVDTLVDVLIVSFHAGAEGSKHQHVTRKTEMFYGENRGNVYAFARVMIDYGADVVFGHGPHVARAIDLYKDRFIAYSMGNFCTYGRFNLRGANGIAPIVKIQTNARGKFLQGQLIAAHQLGAGGPLFDPNTRAIKIIQKLTEKDFPESKLLIEDSGNITYRNK